MSKDYRQTLKDRIDPVQLAKLEELKNPAVIDFIGEYIELCNPKSVFVRTDSAQDIAYLRDKTVELGEERKLKSEGQTIHFDGPLDQARDKKNTKYLLPKGKDLGRYINSMDKDSGLSEVRGYLKDIMQGKEMFICFFCLGPQDSDFSVLAVQITDSSYVAHSEDMLYRSGYEQLKKSRALDFFKFVHSAGELEGAVSKNTDKRRVYIDLEGNTVFSTNTQYAGNTVGLKKLSLRLAIQKASREGWLAEHMFIMGVHGQDKSKSYFCGAYPSMCGKTSTAMVSGESIVGDDIAYLRIRDGRVFAANVERGIFGIIKDVNSQDDPLLFKTLSSQGEVIFSNILIDKSLTPYWIGKDSSLPSEGENFAGKWFPGKAQVTGEEIPPSHKNARFTIRLSVLGNVDDKLEDPKGVEVKGLIYGGRDSDTWCPVEQAFSWQHGIITKAASLESETTAATLGKEGVRVFNPMSNIDFLAVTLGQYIDMNLKFGQNLKIAPPIFSANYFLRGKNRKFLNAMEDKRVWLKWIGLRAEGKAEALLTPTGFIPKYQDLAKLFKEVLGKDYPKEDYIEQFSLRVPENLAKIERIKNIYNDSGDIPKVLFEELEAQKKRLLETQKQFGDRVSPESFKEECHAG